MRITMAAASTDRGRLMLIITPEMAMMVIREENAMGSAWLIICRKVSISLVYRLISSPWGCWSK